MKPPKLTEKAFAELRYVWSQIGSSKYVHVDSVNTMVNIWAVALALQVYYYPELATCTGAEEES